MLPFKTVFLLTFAGLLSLSSVASDSAGIVEMINGLAYGGIPYGSVTGMVANYPGFIRQQLTTRQLNGLGPVLVGQSFQTANLVDVQGQPVQIYNPGVINQLG